jgi:hypothetical protein
MLKSRMNKVRKTGRARPRSTAAVTARDAGEAGPLPRPSKLLTIIAMLRRPEGATIAELSEATGWKPNSVRGAISGSIRKRRLMKVSSDLVSGVRTYRITG